MKYLFVLIISSLVLVSCTKEKTPSPECPTEISFMNDVQPIMQTNCSTSGCHDASGSGGYVLLDYSQISANVDIIIDVMNQVNGVSPMPFGGSKLPDSTIAIISCWKAQGTLDN